MATENLTTYTEVDGSSGLTVTTAKVDASGIDDQYLDYVVKNFTSNHFNAVDLDYETYCDAATQDSGGIGVSLTNTAIGPATGLASTDMTVYSAEADFGGGDIHLSFTLFRGNEVAYDYNNNTTLEGTLYYITISRAAASDTFYCRVYTDSGRTSLAFAALSVNGYDTATRYQYLFALINKNKGNANRDYTGYNQNFNLNETTPTNIDTIKNLKLASIGTINNLIKASMGSYNGLT